MTGPKIPATTPTGLHGTLMAILTRCAENSRICPSVAELAREARVGSHKIGAALFELKRRNLISWKMHRIGNQWIGRTVTIHATGRTTAMPGRPTEAPKPAFTPTEAGCRVRILVGEEFRARAAELEAREAKRHQQETIYGQD